MNCKRSSFQRPVSLKFGWWWIRWIWAVIFVLGCLLTFISVQSTFSKYLNFGVTVGVSLEKKSLIPFPSVTFCNANKVHCGNLYNLIVGCQQVCSLILSDLSSLTWYLIFVWGISNILLMRQPAQKNYAHSRSNPPKNNIPRYQWRTQNFLEGGAWHKRQSFLNLFY